MTLHFEEFDHQIEELIAFMTSETWTFHATTHSEPDRIRKAYDNNYYTNEGCKTFWVTSEEHGKIGLLRVYDLDDGAPLFDIRISGKHRGKGLGSQSINWLVDHVFKNYGDTNRIEGNTREDNYAMRCVFSKCGFVKESHYRKAWECRNGEVYDAIGYGITREDWKAKVVTPVNWHDFKC